MPHAFGDSPEGQGMGEAYELPGTRDPLAQALAVLRTLGASQTPEAQVGASLVPPVQNVGTDLSFAPTGAPANVDPAGAQPDFRVGIDRFGAEQGEPDLEGTAGFDPNAPTFTPPPVPGNLQQARQQEATQYARTSSALYDAEQAKQKAAKDLATRQADAMDRAADNQLTLNTETERATEKAFAAADAETASWLTEMTNLAKQEPNPSRWWDNQSGLGKALWALGMFAGAGRAGMAQARGVVGEGARNAALQMVQEEIARDVALQEARLKREMAVGELKGSVMRQKHTRNLSDIQNRHAREYTRLMALERAYAARVVIPGDLEAEAGKAAALAQIEQMKLPLAAQYRAEAFQAKQQAIAQAHSATQAQLQRDWSAKQAEMAHDRQMARDQQQFIYDLAKSPVSASVSYKPGGPIPVDDKGIPLLREAQSGVGSERTTGAVLVGPDGKPIQGGAIRFRKEDAENFKAFGEITTGASQQYKALKRLDELLSDPDRLATVVAGTVDPELRSLLVTLGTEQAKKDDPGGRYTDRDFSRGLIQSIGFDPDGGWLDRAKFAVNVENTRTMLKKRLAELPAQVNKHVAPLNDAAINGQGTSIVWSPTNLEAPELREPSELEIGGGRLTTGESVSPYPATTREDYARRQRAEAENPNRRGMELVEHDQSTVTHFLDFSEGRGPDAIKREAEKIIRSLGSQGITGEVLDPITGETRPHRQSDEQTKHQVRVLLDAEVKRAADAVKRLEEYIRARQVATGKPVSADTIREAATRKFGLHRAEAEIWRLYNEQRKK